MFSNRKPENRGPFAARPATEKPDSSPGPESPIPPPGDDEVGTAAFVDYYELLQVSPNADEDTIQRVFRHLAKKHHPDASEQDDSQLFNRLHDCWPAC